MPGLSPQKVNDSTGCRYWSRALSCPSATRRRPRPQRLVVVGLGRSCGHARQRGIGGHGARSPIDGCTIHHSTPVVDGAGLGRGLQKRDSSAGTSLSAGLAGRIQPRKKKAPALARRGLVAAPVRWLRVAYMPESVRISMTRRFSWRPSSVALSAIGAVSPLPTELSRAGSTPRDVR